MVRVPQVMDGIDQRFPDCPQSAYQRPEAVGVLRVEAELHMKDVEPLVMVQHPPRRQHGRRPPLADRHVWSRRYRVIEPYHSAAAGRICEMADVHMPSGHRGHPDQAGTGAAPWPHGCGKGHAGCSGLLGTG